MDLNSGLSIKINAPTESFPHIQHTHLWFLYYLASITALFLLARWLAVKLVSPNSLLTQFIHATFRRASASWFAPLVLVLLTLPLIASMTGSDIDTPDKSLVWHWPVLALYGLFFALGWLLHRHADLLTGFGRRWAVYLPISLVVAAVTATGVGLRISGSPWAVEHADALRWATVFGTSLTMSLAVPGWLGLFVRLFDRPMAWVRYLADSSYWVYLIHLPIVVALQIALAKWAGPWWIKWPLINVIAFPVLLLSYHWLVRRTWIGRWLNGKRSFPAEPSKMMIGLPPRFPDRPLSET